MCGIVGIIQDLKGENRQIDDGVNLATALAGNLEHRGPDSFGLWQDPSEKGVTLAHRRLSILDISPNGDQPMISNSERYVLVLNGEIYNHQSLRNLLGNKVHLRGQSDTEVLLACIDVYGLTETLSLLEGMFAFAIWDRAEKTLMLARDRLGEKPLYYGYIDNKFIFLSELSGIEQVFRNQLAIDEQSVADFFLTGRVSAPRSIYKGIFKLPPASFAQLTLDGLILQETPKLQVYWTLPNHQDCETASERKDGGNFDLALKQFETIFTEVVNNQMVADVPLGTFLSGGYDSTAVVAAMTQSSSRRVNTYTIGFDSKTHNEAEHAKKIANFLGTNHTEFYVKGADVLEEAKNIAQKYDEPFADPSQIPTYIVSKCARQHVTVCLTGDGGDELFGGYSRYQQIKKFAKFLESTTPKLLRKIVANQAKKELYKPTLGPLNMKLDRALKAAALCDFSSVENLYSQFTTHHEFHRLLNFTAPLPSDNTSAFSSNSNLSVIRAMMYEDTHNYLHNTILTKVDRASMACSLETRAPFLNHRLVEFVWSLPDDYLLPDGGKKLLKAHVHQRIDRQLMERPKSGFSVPLASWLRGPLKEWWYDTVSTALAGEATKWLNHEAVWQLWKQHQAYDRNWHFLLWKIVMFCDWLNRHARK